MEITCAKCGQQCEPGAVYCGNCGLAIAPANPIAQVLNTPTAPSPIPTALSGAAFTGQAVPAYAIPSVGQQSEDVRATMSVVLGGAGVVAALLLPILGIAFGIAGIVLSTLSHHARKHWVSRLGIGVSVLAITGSLACWAILISRTVPTHSKTVAQTQVAADTTVRTVSFIGTPCYSINFGAATSVQNNAGSCNMNAFNGATFDTSHDGYKIFATNSTVTEAGFMQLAQNATTKDVAQSLPGFKIMQQGPGTFSGSPAYIVTSNNGSVSVLEAAVLHTGSKSTTNNFYVFVHAVTSNSVSLDSLESAWSWQ